VLSTKKRDKEDLAVVGGQGISGKEKKKKKKMSMVKTGASLLPLFWGGFVLLEGSPL